MNTHIIRIDPRRLKLVDVNARFMRHETYQRLVQNIQRDGALTSVPFAALDGVYAQGDAPTLDDAGQPRYEVLSGNHRVKAAIDAGLEEIDLMVTEEPLSHQQRTALQLAHNAIVGEDDPAVLKQLYESLDVDLRPYVGLDDKTLALLKDVSIESLSEPNLDFQIVSYLFLPHEMERVKQVYEAARQMVNGDLVWLARWREYDRLLDTMGTIGAAYGVLNGATVLMLMLDLVERHLVELAEGWTDGETVKHKGWVPLATVLGTDKMPAEAARVVRQAVETMVSRDDLSPNARWQALEKWAADYLAGA